MAIQSHITSAERINELSAISADVSAMLGAAGKAINALTNRPLNASEDQDEEAGEMAVDTVEGAESRKETFAIGANDYFTGLQATMARLRRQAYALEEAGIISAQPTTLSLSTQQKQQQPAIAPRGPRGAAPSVQQVPEIERITNGGLGDLDIGWLNSRGNKVGAEKEAELVGDAKRMLEERTTAEMDGTA